MPCGQPSKRRQHLAGLVAVVVDRLLAEDDKAGLFGDDDRLQNFRDRQRLDRAIGLHQDAAVGAHGERGADGFAGLLRADRDGDDFRRLAGFLQPDRFFDGDLAKRVHRHLDVGKLDAGAVRLDADLDVLVDRPFHRHEDFHRTRFSRVWYAHQPRRDDLERKKPARQREVRN